jgi:hypothetical protein
MSMAYLASSMKEGFFQASDIKIILNTIDNNGNQINSINIPMPEEVFNSLLIFLSGKASNLIYKNLDTITITRTQDTSSTKKITTNNFSLSINGGNKIKIDDIINNNPFLSGITNIDIKLKQ